VSFDLGPNLTQIFLAGIAIIPAIIAAYYARKAGLAALEAKAVAEDSIVKAVETHDLVNSRMSELLELTRSSARAEGVVEGLALPVPEGTTNPNPPLDIR